MEALEASHIQIHILATFLLVNIRHRTNAGVLPLYDIRMILTLDRWIRTIISGCLVDPVGSAPNASTVQAWRSPK
jgi:hypothetical protein